MTLITPRPIPLNLFLLQELILIIMIKKGRIGVMRP
jgi:hypothetical protein